MSAELADEVIGDWDGLEVAPVAGNAPGFFAPAGGACTGGCLTTGGVCGVAEICGAGFAIVAVGNAFATGVAWETGNGDAD